ncbi:MAG: response regulator transcription factor [bacterium]
MDRIRVVIADDHKILREGLKSLMEKEKDIEVVGEAENGKKTLDVVEKAAPHIVVMDVAMADLNGMEATRRLKKINPSVKVIGLSGHPNRSYVTEMLKAGASGYVVKSRAYEDLVRAIREVLAGNMYLSPEVTPGVVDTHFASSKKANPAFATLTAREREVLQLLAEGKTTKWIASELTISVKTVETHRRNIMEKLDLHSVAELTKYAVREGVSPLDA